MMELIDSPTAVHRAAVPLRFMDLPNEIRMLIYEMVLPSKHHLIMSDEWASKSTREMQNFSRPERCIGLLLVSKRIHSEARDVLYARNCFTIETSSYRQTEFLGVDLNQIGFLPFPWVPCMPYLRHLQLDLKFDTYYCREKYPHFPEMRPHVTTYVEDDRYEFREVLLTICNKLATEVQDLQTLKIRVPCICNPRNYKQVPLETIYESILSALEPLQQLHFKRKVTFIPWNFPSKDNWNKLVQCPTPRCLAFAASFTHFTRKLLQDPAGTTTTWAMSARDSDWMQMRREAERLLARATWKSHPHLPWAWRDARRWKKPEDEFEQKIRAIFDGIKQEGKERVYRSKYRSQTWRNQHPPFKELGFPERWQGLLWRRGLQGKSFLGD